MRILRLLLLLGGLGVVRMSGRGHRASTRPSLFACIFYNYYLRKEGEYSGSDREYSVSDREYSVSDER
jgi:hypothetical protein